MQYDPLVINEFEDEVFRLPVHSHTYYELIYIVKGCGKHNLNRNIIPYRTGDLFLLSPGDEHNFDINKTTHFIYIKFTADYFKVMSNNFSSELLRLDPEEIMRYRMFKETKIVLEEPYRSVLKNTFRNIADYSKEKNVTSSPLIFFQVLSIFGLIKESFNGKYIDADNTYPGREQLITYIHEHIYEPAQIQIKIISAHFNIAPSYFSAYFKRNIGISYREYTNTLRAGLVEKRIAAGNITLKQIADEFGFTDESHVSNYFRKKKAINPRAYKKQMIAV
jgi:AraC-like DNA-binding protein